MKLTNEYLVQVLEQVKKRNPNEPEFIQAVTEVFVTLQPVIEQRPDLVKSGVIERLVENIKRLIAFGNMHVHTDLIVGLPYENIEIFEKSFDAAYSLKAHMLQMGFLKLLYGAQMRENSELYPCTFTSEPPYEVTSTPWLCEDEIKSLKKLNKRKKK